MRRSRWLVFLLVGLAGFIAQAGHDESREAWILFRAEIPLFRTLNLKLAGWSHLTPIPCPLETVSESFLQSHPPGLVIALGDSGLKRALSLPWSAPIIAAFVDCRQEDPRVRVVDLGLLPFRQLEVLSKIPGNRRRVFYPYSAKNLAPSKALMEVAGEFGMELKPYQLLNPKSWQAFFDLLGTPGDAVLLPVDPQLMNNAFLDPLFLNSFHDRFPIVGFSETLVQKGALFSLVLSPDRMANDLMLLGEDLYDAKFKGHPPRREVSPWDLHINETVARKLGISLPADLVGTARMRY